MILTRFISCVIIINCIDRIIFFLFLYKFSIDGDNKTSKLFFVGNKNQKLHVIHKSAAFGYFTL